MSRLGHAVAPLDGIVELVIHRQLWIRGATCQGTETGTLVSQHVGSGRVSSQAHCPGVYKSTIPLALETEMELEKQ